jgi:hypothetical protein
MRRVILLVLSAIARGATGFTSFPARWQERLRPRGGPVDVVVHENAPSFVCAHPTDEVVHVFHAHPQWVHVKLKSDNPEDSARCLNELTLAEIKAGLTLAELIRHELRGERLAFGDDIVIEPAPFCSVAWLMTAPSTIRNEHDVLTLRSPVLRTPPGLGRFDSRLNAKLVNPAWIADWFRRKL